MSLFNNKKNDNDYVSNRILFLISKKKFKEAQNLFHKSLSILSKQDIMRLYAIIENVQVQSINNLYNDINNSFILMNNNMIRESQSNMERR